MSRVLLPCVHPRDADAEALAPVHPHPGYRPSCPSLRPEVIGNKGLSNRSIDRRVWLHLFACQVKQGGLRKHKSQKTCGPAICFHRKKCSCRTRARIHARSTHITQATQCGPAPDSEPHPCRKDLPSERRGPANLRLNPPCIPLPLVTGCPTASRTPGPTTSPSAARAGATDRWKKRHLSFLPRAHPSSSEGPSLFHLLSHDARTGPISAVPGPSE